jgi:hypothetical protein
MIRLTRGLARSCGRSTIDSLWMWSPDVRQPSWADRRTVKSTTRRSNPATANLGMAFAGVNSQGTDGRQSTEEGRDSQCLLERSFV